MRDIADLMGMTADELDEYAAEQEDANNHQYSAWVSDYAKVVRAQEAEKALEYTDQQMFVLGMQIDTMVALAEQSKAVGLWRQAKSYEQYAADLRTQLFNARIVEADQVDDSGDNLAHHTDSIRDVHAVAISDQMQNS